ncbi:hypothetical protein MTO96_020585 [Rhipicephalus appendiculatus]
MQEPSDRQNVIEKYLQGLHHHEDGYSHGYLKSDDELKLFERSLAAVNERGLVSLPFILDRCCTLADSAKGAPVLAHRVAHFRSRAVRRQALSRRVTLPAEGSFACLTFSPPTKVVEGEASVDTLLLQPFVGLPQVTFENVAAKHEAPRLLRVRNMANTEQASRQGVPRDKDFTGAQGPSRTAAAGHILMET